MARCGGRGPILIEKSHFFSQKSCFLENRHPLPLVEILATILPLAGRKGALGGAEMRPNPSISDFVPFFSPLARFCPRLSWADCGNPRQFGASNSSRLQHAKTKA